MCVLIVKRAGDKLPNDTILKMCYQANPDGCGFSTVRAWFKTLDFQQFLRVLKKHVSVNDDCLIHFRFATHGSVKKENCHPFIDRGAGVALGSKFAFLDKNEGLKTYGEFYAVKGCNCLFSNLRWDYSRFYVKPKITETKGKRQNIWSYELDI